MDEFTAKTNEIRRLHKVCRAKNAAVRMDNSCYKITICKYENSKERETSQELLISASHPRVALGKALRIVSKSKTLGKWSGQAGNLQMTYERLTEREAKKFAAMQAMQTIGGCA